LSHLFITGFRNMIADDSLSKGGAADVQALVGAVDRLVRSMAVNKAPALWSTEDIANWMGLAERTVMARVVTRPGFPEAFAPTGPSDGLNTQKRWFAEEVIEWARRHRASLRPKRGRSRQVPHD
jgi:hypothetical protein